MSIINSEIGRLALAEDFLLVDLKFGNVALMWEVHDVEFALVLVDNFSSWSYYEIQGGFGKYLLGINVVFSRFISLL